MLFVLDLWLSEHWVVQGLLPACAVQAEHHSRGTQGNGYAVVLSRLDCPALFSATLTRSTHREAVFAMIMLLDVGASEFRGP